MDSFPRNSNFSKFICDILWNHKLGMTRLEKLCYSSHVRQVQFVDIR